MLRSSLIMLAAAAGIALPGPAAHAGAEDVLAEVNGQPITRAMYDGYLERRIAQGEAEAGPRAVLGELVGQELIYQDAVKQGLDEDPEVQRRLEALRRNLIISAALERHLEAQPVDDAAVKAAYERMVEAQKGQEYKARHILVESEEEAKTIIAALDDGADFAALAKEKSTGPSGKQGGDLGWFRPQQMVPPFSAAAAKLKPGEYTAEPVKTRFGWHVILLEDTSDLAPPPLDQVADKVRSLLQQQRLRDYVRGLEEGAEVSLHPERL
jgi:peptidyl-prolyl cis-trans isomerase C